MNTYVSLNDQYIFTIFKIDDYWLINLHVGYFKFLNIIYLYYSKTFFGFLKKIRIYYYIIITNQCPC